MNHLHAEPPVATAADVAPPTALPGQPRRPTVVLVHASGGTSRQWGARAERLRPAFDVHVIDHHGHGTQDPWRAPRRASVYDEAAR